MKIEIVCNDGMDLSITSKMLSENEHVSNVKSKIDEDDDIILEFDFSGKAMDLITLISEDKDIEYNQVTLDDLLEYIG